MKSNFNDYKIEGLKFSFFVLQDMDACSQWVNWDMHLGFYMEIWFTKATNTYC